MQTDNFPRRLTVELTNRCNYACAMCPSRFHPEAHTGLISPELFGSIVEQAAEHGPALVPFFRGESLLHPRLVEFITLAKGRGLGPIQLATNGSLLEAELAAALLDAGLDFISFSLDTVDPEEYAAIRKGGELAKVMANVLRFIELRDRGGHATQVQVSATRTGLNHQSLERFKEYWRPRADRVRIYYEHSKDGHTGSLDCPETDVAMERRPCAKVFQDMVTLYDGAVVACNHDWFRQAPLGSLAERSISQVWHGPAYEALRRQHLHPAEMKDETCMHCDHWKIAHLPEGMIGELYTRGEAANEA